MKRVVSVSLGPQSRNYEFQVELWGDSFHVRRLGTDGDTRLARRLVGEHDGQVDCIALGGMAVNFRVGRRTWSHKETLRIARAARTTPVVGGRALRQIVDPWAIGELVRWRQDLFEDANVLFLSGIANWDLLSAVHEYTDSMSFADPVLHYGVPKVLPSVAALETYARAAMPLLTRRPYVSFFPRGRAAEGIQSAQLLPFFQRADVVVGDLRQLLHYAPRDLAHKVIVTDRVDDDSLSRFRDAGVDVVCTTAPLVLGDRRADLQVLHACCVAHLEKEPARIETTDYLELLDALDARPRLIHPQGEVRRRHKFAYLYYPPDRRSLFRDPRLRWLRTVPPEVQARVEQLMALRPVRALSQVRGITSPSGEEAEGWILYLPVTAGEITARGPAYARERLREATRLAQRLGASILGVGAFSREVTLATRDVAGESDIPITSGCSYLVSADTWAAKESVLAMGIEQDEVGRAIGMALVVGAGDPQAAVAAELLALVFHRLVVVDAESEQLEDLVERIEARSPHCQVQVVSSPDAHLAEAHLVVTGLSPRWTRVDVEALRPGAVLCDFARPEAFGRSEAEARPDVLIVKAGEIELPGPVDIGAKLGPPNKTSFASLAEVVALSLEGRYECFTLGVDVRLDAVKEMYQLGLRHGMQLSGMRGTLGPLSDYDVKLVRERSEARQRAQQAPPPLETAGPEVR